MTELNLAQCSQYCNDEFHLRLKAQRLKEYRKKPVERLQPRPPVAATKTKA